MRIESIGDNCELGFVQRACNLEPVGLLRWATTPPEGLLKLLKQDFAGLYQFENLEPANAGMVRDRAYSIAFHTQLTSTDGVFNASEAERRRIYAQESGKIQYLTGKLRQRLAEGSVLFIYKRNKRIPDAQIFEIGAEIARRGPGQLLYVTDNAPALLPGEMRRISGNTHIGRITRFAPYNRANDIDLDAWLGLLDNARQRIPLPDEAASGA